MWKAFAANASSLESALCLQLWRKCVCPTWKKRHETEARIEEKNIKLHTYKVAHTSPLTGKKERKWVPVDDITSLTLQREKEKQKAAKLSKRKKAQHHKMYHIVMRNEDYVQDIEDQDFELVCNPPGDGNCQFAALSHQVRKLGILRSPETMRKEIVAYLESNPYDTFRAFGRQRVCFVERLYKSYGTRWILWGSVNSVCGS